MTRPDWLKVKLPGGGRFDEVRRQLGRLGLNTVCNEARCPNRAECWGSGTAAVMILGRVCSRGCRFCDVTSGRPPAAPDAEEPQRIAQAVSELGLRYVVITSVDRDDLPDGGAQHFVGVVRAVRERTAGAVTVELLTPDFRGRQQQGSLRRVAGSGAQVLGHNIETVRRLTPRVRDRRCDYDLSLEVLRTYRACGPGLLVKSSLLLGLGERDREVEQALVDLRQAGVDWVTLGQYLQPSRQHVAVARYVTPEEFDRLAAVAREIGFAEVTAGPLVRSSYRAAEARAARLFASRRNRGDGCASTPG